MRDSRVLSAIFETCLKKAFRKSVSDAVEAVGNVSDIIALVTCDMTRRHYIKMHCWDLNWIRSDQAAVAVGGAGEESWDRKYRKGLYKQEKRVESCERK
jgi:hypothetical protein